MKRRIIHFALPAMAALMTAAPGGFLAQAGQFQITTNNTSKAAFRAAFDGANYLVGIQGNNLFNRADTNSQVAVQLVSQSGTVVTPLIDTGRNAGHFFPEVAFGGTNYLVVWADSATTPTNRVYGQFVSTNGGLAAGAFPISTNHAGDQIVHGIAFDGTNYLVVWDDHRRGTNASVPNDIYGQRVSRSGALVGSEIRISPADSSRDYEDCGGVVFDGTNYFVVWLEGLLSGTTETDVKGQFVSPGGALAGSEITVKSDGVQIGSPQIPAIGFDGTNYLISWHQDLSASEHDLRAQRVSRAGALVGSQIAISAAPANASLATIAFDGTNYLVTWVDSFGSTNQSCKARFLDRAGNAVSFEFAPFVAQGANPPIFSSALFDGKQYFLAGTLGIFGVSGDVYGAFAAPFPYGTFPIATTSGGEAAVSSAFDGTNYLVGVLGDATDHGNITAQLVSTNRLLIGARISVGRMGGTPVVGFGGTNYLLVWEDVTGGPYHIYGQRVSQGGALIGGAFQISLNSSTRQVFDLSLNPLAFDGTNFLVVWQDQGVGGTNFSILGRLVSTAGTLVGSEIAFTPGQHSPAVAFDGTNYLVVWQNNDRAGGQDAFNTYGSVVSRAGVAGTSFLINQFPSTYHFPPAVACDGSNCLVTLERTTEWPPILNPPGNLDLYARFVSRVGAPIGNEFPITTATGSQWFPVVAYDGAEYLISWGDIGGLFPAVKARYFSRAGAAISGEFALYGSQGPGRLAEFGGFSVAGGQPFALVSYLDSSFKGGDVYGVFVQPARLDVAKLVAGQLPLKLSGMPGLAYQVQAATNLSGPVWTPVTNLSLLNPTFNFTDPVSVPRRFYRAVLQ